jgi:4-hydroxythreonine-4-phosphate dehydrogenase
MFIKPKKSLGQNFLIDRNVLEQIVDTVEITNKEVLEIFFKTLKVKKIKKPIILIASYHLVVAQMKALNFNFKINIITKNIPQTKDLENAAINLIDVDFKFKKKFDKISNKSNSYINKSFEIALNLLMNFIKKILKKNQKLQ